MSSEPFKKKGVTLIATKAHGKGVTLKAKRKRIEPKPELIASAKPIEVWNTFSL